MSDEGTERATLIEAILDKIKPIPENAPDDVKDAIDTERQVLAMRADWTTMPIEELREKAQKFG